MQYNCLGFVPLRNGEQPGQSDLLLRRPRAPTRRAVRGGRGAGGRREQQGPARRATRSMDLRNIRNVRDFIACPTCIARTARGRTLVDTR